MPEQVKLGTPEQPATPLSGSFAETPGSSEAEPRSVESGSSEKLEAQPTATPIQTPAPAVVSTADAARVAEIERVLEDDLSELYFKLPEDKRAEFRVRGEAAAREIDVLLSAATVQVRKIIDIIRNWLKLIPGINTFFLEQEAKIKADHLLKMRGR